MSITAEDRQAIRELYGRCCGFCGVSESDIGGELQIDHYRPVTRGGSDEPDNLVYACVHCNRFKGNYWPDEE
jgi:5-methylcytosine-specific restriction endonuclease McrA